MSNRKLLVSALLPITVVAASGAASAGVMSPPTYTGMGATYQCWDFPTPGNPAPADPGYVNPFGVPMYLASAGATWQPQNLGKNGVWTLNPNAAGTGDFLDFRIPNMPDLSHQKLVKIEVKYFGGFPGAISLPPVVSGLGFGPPIDNLIFTGHSTKIAPNNPDWSIDTWFGYFDHCPSTESITIAANPMSSAPTFIDWVCINTVCVPTPGAGVLLSAGGLLCAVRRRRA